VAPQARQDDPTAALLAAVEPAAHPARVIHRLVAMTRERLGLEVAFVSEFGGGQRVFRFVDGDTSSFEIEVDAGDPLEETYCHHIVSGALDGLIPDTNTDPTTRDMPVTADRSLGAYVGVPVVFADGRVFGTFCAASNRAQPGLEPRDLEFLRISAALVAEQLERDHAVGELSGRAVEVARAAARGEGLAIVHQPIFDLSRGELIAVEALSRFAAEPVQPPDVWFAHAWAAGVGRDLELVAAQRALADIDALPDGVRMDLNISPETLLCDEAMDLLATVPEGRVVVEITEHEPFHGSGLLRARLDELRSRGIICALDDMGTGYAGLATLLALHPEVHKIDGSIVRGIRTDRARRALVAGWVAYAEQAGAKVVAEGIETAEELDTLRILNVRLGQGFHLARPAPIAQLQLTPSV
jgi:EAL domain-containing protein (putative c-di-GMP-specific phosphodiesterase class I)